MKKFINKVDDVVSEQMEGMLAAHPDAIKINLDPKYITRAGAPIQGKVAIVSGGGSGHEPMHGGFVGMGMLDAACPGEVFTSPTPDQMYEAGKAVNGGAGVLFIVKNYTGDVLNFETAVEMLAAEGIPVQSILVDDDTAVKDSLYTAGRRGVGATVLMEKIVGGAAEDGYDLHKLADLARKANINGRSIGVALTSCVVPSAGKPTFDLPEDEFEFGVGIHGEPGRERYKMKDADSIAKMMVDAVVDDAAYARTIREWDNENSQWVDKELIDPPLASGDEVICFVNSMGGTPVSELYGLYTEVAAQIEAKGLKIVRKLIGPYITSLEMQGASLTLMKVDDEILKYWDVPVNTPGLRWGV
jgi:phosphoenolpyruvate---glycerone phosphotransferase subunit DhaK